VAEPAPSTSLGQRLEQALALVAREAPAHFVTMCARLGPRTADVRIGDEPSLRVSLDREPPWVRDEGAGVPDLHLTLSRATLARLLRGETTIEEAILDETLGARGDVPAMLAFFDALAAWLHGAMRAPSLPRLHAQCLADTLAAADRQKGSRP
jgi:hypothetical protein